MFATGRRTMKLLLVKALAIVLAGFAIGVRGDTKDKQDMPQSLWKWPNSGSSYFNTPVPSSSANADYNAKSGCGGGGDDTIGWSCPHLMLLSPDMQYAAEADNNSWAVYAVAGIGSANDCGSCYQLEITSGGSPYPNKFIVQAVNTGSDVSSGQFDILLGAGGFGIYDSCSSDCQYGRVCSGGHCNAPQYTGNFDAWTPDGNCYGGGIHNAGDCYKLDSSSTFAGNTLRYGCATALNRGYHLNFNVQWFRVGCPDSLSKLTGIRRKDDLQHPKPHLQLKLSNSGRTTTTMDCCKPTCAWRQNVASITDPQLPQVYTCGKTGLPNTT